MNRSIRSGLGGSLMLLWLTGCSARSAPSDAGLGLEGTLLAELEQLRGFLGLRTLALAGLVLVLAVFGSRLLRAGTLLVWSLGLDANRRLELWSSGVRIAAVIVGLLWALGRLASVAPILVTLTAFAAGVVLVLASSRQMPSVASGLSLLLRRKLRHGDRIHIAGHSGTVREVGLTQLQLRRGDGATVFVPNKLIAEAVLTVEHSKNTEPARAPIPGALPHDRETLQLARRVASLSPYRVPGSPVELVDDVEGDATGRLAVEIHSWSDRSARQATQQLTWALEDAQRQVEASKNS